MQYSSRELQEIDEMIFNGGLWPPIFNAASKAILHANATCGMHSREEFCHMTDAHPQRKHKRTKCGACDAEHNHPIDNVIDRSSKWWQSPTLLNGLEYEYVTITMDLKQVSKFYNIVRCLVLNIKHFTTDI